jgi:L-seryl-tRNA(Ser) seleniumtransferase
MPDFHVIPSIDQVRQRPAIRSLEARFGAAATVAALREAAAEVRNAIAAGETGYGTEDAVTARLETASAARLSEAFRPSLVRVINASGVILHTNLGRAPLAAPAIDRIAEVARGYSSLEFDLELGTRGRRDIHAEALLCRLTRAEAAVIVNNNAAATMVVLAALAAGREVIVSRGELIEIGGGFRIPEVMAQSGAILREVGTTNKTRASDYGAAISERTALILRVHPSNFRIEGFTERTALAELVALGRKFNIPVAEDLGSGNLVRVAIGSRSGRDQVATGSDPTVQDSIAAGVDVCCFSGDKLLGGPQAGIIAGRAAIVERIRTHPLMRALRVDKITYAALEATLAEYAAGRAAETIPVQRMLTATAGEIRVRAEALANAITRNAAWHATLEPGASAVGGGSAPGVELPTWLVAIAKDGSTPDALDTRLRNSTPPIVARIERGHLLLDLRTVAPDEDSLLVALLKSL